MSEWTDEKHVRWLALEGTDYGFTTETGSELYLLRVEFCQHSYEQLTSGEAEPEKRLYTELDLAKAINEGTRIGLKVSNIISDLWHETETGKKIRGKG